MTTVNEGKNFIAITTSMLKLQPELKPWQADLELVGLNYAELNFTELKSMRLIEVSTAD